MDEAKRKKLAAKGWKVGTVEEFLGLTPEEAAKVEMKVALGRIAEPGAKKSILTMEGVS